MGVRALIRGLLPGACIARGPYGRCGAPAWHSDWRTGERVCIRHRPRRCDRCRSGAALCTVAGVEGRVCGECLRAIMAHWAIAEGD